MELHTESNTQRLQKLSNVSSIAGRSDTHCRINKMLTPCILSLSTRLVFSLQNEKNDMSKLDGFILFHFPAKAEPSTTVELPIMYSSLEIKLECN